jgi:hypothetical protein
MDIGLPVVAGMISTSIFALSTLPMLVKAAHTRDLRSYSLGNILLSNLGNVIHSIYVFHLPLGPMWVLHSFYLITSALMLFWYLRYALRPTSGRATVPVDFSPRILVLADGTLLAVVTPHRPDPLKERQEAANRVGQVGVAGPAGSTTNRGVAAQLGCWKAGLQEGLEQLLAHAVSRISGSKSTPTTWPCGSTSSARSSTTSPAPLPTSSTFIPAVRPAAVRNWRVNGP